MPESKHAEEHPSRDLPEDTTTSRQVDEPATSQPPRPSSRRPLIIGIIAIVGILGLLGLGAAGGALLQRTFSSGDQSILQPTQDGNISVTQEESTVAAIAEKVSPSVVSVVTETRTRSFYGTYSAEGAGTGIIVSKDGYIMTNNHVIDGATRVAIVDHSGEEYENVRVVGRDPLNDVAFLKVSAKKEFTPAVLGNSSTVRIGQQVIAIGNALGQYSNTVTSGIISGLGRPITANTNDGSTESLTDLIQTDASINEGNSGGPLVNMAGQVIGINTAIIENANGIGFSIPINSTKGVLSGVLASGEIKRAYLGINYLTITSDVARQFDLPVNSGAYIYSEGRTAIASDGPAANSGLKQGDIITKVNSDTVGSAGGLSSIIGQYKPGETVTLTYLRNGSQATTTITLGSYSR